MGYNPSILPRILEARQLTLSNLSERLRMGADKLAIELDREPSPPEGVLNSIAKELALPSFVFFMSEPPPLRDLIADFRSDKPELTPKAIATVKAIQAAAAIQELAGQVAGRRKLGLPTLEVGSHEKADDAAWNARTFFGISVEDQSSAANSRAFYSLCRKKIEDAGIFVMQDRFPQTDGSGFCLSDPSHPAIVINTTKQTKARRLFTLVHELAHVLIHASGISDPFVTRNKTESFCNRFASSFLVPEVCISALLAGIDVPKEPSVDDVRKIAGRLKISQQATVLRLEQLKLCKVGSHDLWLKAVHNTGNPDYAEKGGGAAGPPPQEKVKLAKYGFSFATTFDEPIRSGLISDLSLFRVSGLKPKYQRAYFDYTKSLTPTDLQSLEFSDE